MKGREFHRTLWSTGADMAAMLPMPGRDVPFPGSFSLFSVYCRQGRLDKVERIVKETAALTSLSFAPGMPSLALIDLLESRESMLRLSPLLVIQSVGKHIAASDFSGTICQGQVKCARLLLKYGARPDAKDVVGKTVVHYGAGNCANATSMKICDMCIRAYQSSHLFAKEVQLYGLANASLNGSRGICRGFVEETNRRAVYLLD